jgi:hypothetical protein
MRPAALLALLLTLGCGRSSQPPDVAPKAPSPESDSAEREAASAREGDEAALLAAGEAYVRERRDPGVPFEVRPHAREGDFALLLVSPEIEGADSALLVMKREGEAWRGIHMDTALICEALTDAGAPASLCEKL